jgi:hypothetical protein
MVRLIPEISKPKETCEMMYGLFVLPFAFIFIMTKIYYYIGNTLVLPYTEECLNALWLS